MLPYLSDLHLKPPSFGFHAHHYYRGLSLLTGWFPLIIEISVVIAVLLSIGKRSLRWYVIFLPLAAVIGIGVSWLIHRYLVSSGLMNDAAPFALWVWLAIFGAACAIIILGWRNSGWIHRIWTVVAAFIATLTVFLSLNQWVGYYSNIESLWSDLISGPLQDEIEPSSLSSYEGKGAEMKHGVVVPLYSPSNISNFVHRTEYVYLPPAYFLPSKPHLPAVMMIGGEFNTSYDWIRSGGAIDVVDDYAHDHAGEAPILAFVDVSGAFNNDTECVDGPRGNTATHINQEFRPYIINHFRADANPHSWAVIGWSMGGTCAVNLNITHPELYHTFINILGDAAPNTGNAAQTLSRLYGGKQSLAHQFNPYQQLIVHRGQYSDTAGISFITRFDPKLVQRFLEFVKKHKLQESDDAGYGGRYSFGSFNFETKSMDNLCIDGKKEGVTCTVIDLPMGHSWQIAEYEFYRCLPWLAARFRLPDAGDISMPTS